MPTIQLPEPVSKYVLGDVWTPKLTITVGGVRTDPVTLSARAQRPDGTTYDLVYGTDQAVVRLSVGEFVFLVTMTQVKRWRLRPVATVATAGGTILRKTEWWADCTTSQLASPN